MARIALTVLKMARRRPTKLQNVRALVARSEKCLCRRQCQDPIRMLTGSATLRGAALFSWHRRQEALEGRLGLLYGALHVTHVVRVRPSRIVVFAWMAKGSAIGDLGANGGAPPTSPRHPGGEGSPLGPGPWGSPAQVGGLLEWWAATRDGANTAQPTLPLLPCRPGKQSPRA